MAMAQTSEHIDKTVGRIMKKISVSKDDDNPGYWKITYRKKTGQTIVVDEQLLENIIILYRLGSNPADKEIEKTLRNDFEYWLKREYKNYGEWGIQQNLKPFKWEWYF